MHDLSIVSFDVNVKTKIRTSTKEGLTAVDGRQDQ
jgi:hypothetical protein